MNTLDVTKEQRSNLARLALYLRKQKPSEEFDMAWYAARGGNEITPYMTQKHPCGTTCCAAGTGPKIGIKAKRGEDWYDYTSRAFIGDTDSNVSLFLFGGYHEDIPYLAAKRIAWLLCDNEFEDPYTMPDDFAKWRPNWKKVEGMVNA